MKGPFDDPKEVARAKRIASGELGQQIVRFPLQFAEPVIIGSVPEDGKEPVLNNGTATLVQIGERQLAVTCAHVLAEFRRRRDEGIRQFVFQIGMLEFDCEDRLAGYDEFLDLAVFDITGLKHSRASTRSGGGPFRFHEPSQWPPTAATTDELVSVAGYPGAWRQAPINMHIDFDTFSIGAQPVTSSLRNRIALQFDRDYWVSAFGDRGKDFKLLGGMSGGPIMVMRRLHWDLAGIVTHFSEEWDVLFGAPALRICTDGSIDPE
jgi:hypothetical protein